MADVTAGCHPCDVAPREARFYRRSSNTGLAALAPAMPVAGRRRLPTEMRKTLERLAAELAAVGPPPPVQLYRTARRAEDLIGPLLHVGMELDMLRFEKERALEQAAVTALRQRYSPGDIARASGLDRTWLLDQLT
jgi:hypothetical protein